MNLTLGFIAFFVSLIIPGIIFRRFYFFGEFSKQYNTKDPVLHSIFFSIIPGILLQITGFILYFLFIGFDSSFSDVFTIFRDITSNSNNATQDVTRNFMQNDILTFALYSLYIFIFSAFSGFALSRIIRKLNWDKKYKIFRFKNQWYYIFSGELLFMKKFKLASKIHSDNEKPKSFFEIFVTYADILVNISENKRDLYSGYVIDYDLKAENPSKLDRIYLMNTYRYKYPFKQGNNNLTKQKQIRIPGDIFVIDADRIVNINLTYIPSYQKKIVKELVKKQKKQKRYKIINFIYFILLVVFIMFHFLYVHFNLDDTYFDLYIQNTNFIGKFITFLLITQILSFFVPEKNKVGEYSYSKKNFIDKFIGFIIFLVLAYFFSFKNIF